MTQWTQTIADLAEENRKPTEQQVKLLSLSLRRARVAYSGTGWATTPFSIFFTKWT